MLKIKLEIDALNTNTQNLLEETLNDKKLLDKLSEILDDKDSMLKLSIDDKENIKIEEVKKDEISEGKIEQNVSKDMKKEKTSLLKKVTKSFFRIFEEFFDSVAKNFLKKKYKINNSVYNDGKKAVIAIRDKDSKTFLKKVTDAVLNMIKKIPTDKKKIIKNTKNIAIDEIYSWK